MKYSLFCLLLFLYYSGYSQFYVGDSRDDAKAALLRGNIKFEESRLSDTTYRFSWIIKDRYQVILVFDTNNVVTSQTIIPEKDEHINGIVKWFNRDLVIVSDSEWKHYANGTIYKVELLYIDKFALFKISPSANVK